MNKLHALVSLVFDDGYLATFKNALPILKANHLRATFAVCTEPLQIEKKEGIKCANKTILDQARKDGHEIASHSITHRALISLPLEQVEMELKNSAQTLNANSLVYPGGANNLEVQKIARRYYVCARGVEEGVNFLPIAPQEFFNLKCVVDIKKKGFQKLKWQRKIKKYIKSTAEKGGWLILGYHLLGIKNSKNYKFFTSLKDFNKHLEWIKKYNLTVLPLAEAVEKIKTPLQ